MAVYYKIYLGVIIIAKDNVIQMTMKIKPLSNAEREENKRTLYKWKDLIDRGKLEEAKELMPIKPLYVFNSTERPLSYLYCLFEARYFRAIGDKEAFNNAMSYLDKVAPEFDNEFNYYYYRLIGTHELEARRYKTAFKAFCKAEEVGTPDLYDVGFCYAFGLCLADMGFTARAIENFEKALILADKSKYHLYDIYIKGFMAYDYSKMGKGDEALEILKACSLTQKIRNNDDTSVGFLYLTYGLVYYYMKEYDNAIASYDSAFRYFAEGSAAYVRTIYRKAQSLISMGRAEEGVDCIDRGFHLFDDEVEWSAIWTALYDALRHSALLSVPGSIEHLKNNGIPKLMDFGQYEEAIDCCKQVSAFYENAGDIKQAYEYSQLAIKVYEKYINERMKGVVSI